MARRVLVLTQWFDPEPTIKGLPFARELQRRGFTVEVLTGFPNYPYGRLYDGYRLRWRQREVVDGVVVHRVPLYPSHDGSGVRRALNYASFAASAFLYGLGLVRRFDVIYAYHPPLSVGVVAALLGKLWRRPVVYDVQDLWPDTLAATGMIRSPGVLRVVGSVCRWVYRNVDRIAVLSPGFRTLLVQRGVPPDKVDVIYNWADDTALASRAGPLPEGFPADDGFKIVFAGNMGKAQGLDAVLDAARLLQGRGARVTFVLIGGGTDVPALRARAASLGLDNVVFLPPVPMARIGQVLAAADALLVHLRKDPLFEVTIPSKTQAYMFAGKPILLAVDGDASRLVQAAAAGIVAESGNPASIAEAALALAALEPSELASMGDRAARYYAAHLSRENGTARFAALFDRVAAGT
jgi:glycosyltransferase involved in cell wall biosynthesis